MGLNLTSPRAVEAILLLSPGTDGEVDEGVPRNRSPISITRLKSVGQGTYLAPEGRPEGWDDRECLAQTPSIQYQAALPFLHDDTSDNENHRVEILLELVQLHDPQGRRAMPFLGLLIHAPSQPSPPLPFSKRNNTYSNLQDGSLAHPVVTTTTRSCLADRRRNTGRCCITSLPSLCPHNWPSRDGNNLKRF
ncbi:hypothetical protein CDEST_12303 [Colletotrichum destructivum]|uniref:Protein kinase domain-containing protein n=1 Tax=Colletotrichum destructivum TaxID=34406 RepID=A0AAX4IVN9_9PEZI|nr:hypothetical protein CDEST_12303 [Colletotrichum destructivum]